MMSNLEEAFNQDNNEHEEDMNVQSSSQEFFEQPHGSQEDFFQFNNAQTQGKSVFANLEHASSAYGNFGVMPRGS